MTRCFVLGEGHLGQVNVAVRLKLRTCKVVQAREMDGDVRARTSTLLLLMVDAGSVYGGSWAGNVET